MKKPRHPINRNSFIWAQRWGSELRPDGALTKWFVSAFLLGNSFPHLKHEDDCPDHRLSSNVLSGSSVWSLCLMFPPIGKMEGMLEKKFLWFLSISKFKYVSEVIVLGNMLVLR